MPASFKVKAVYDYKSPHDDDLSFPNGQIITVTEEEDDDWYYGEYKSEDGSNNEGLFPRNFVERYEPVTPPRPSRPTKKETAAPAPSHTTPKPEPDQFPERSEQNEVQGLEGEEETVKKAEPSSAVPSKESANEPPAPTQVPKSPELTSPPPAPAATKPPPPPREVPQEATKEAPLATVEKSGPSSFRDRIAAFNKAAAPPVAPKPAGKIGGASSSFIKKQYVAPPPSRNAYVPPPREPLPQKVYQREENTEAAPQEKAELETIRSPPVPTASEEVEGQPQPTSLKERIALLQKQQLEQASRHAEAAAKKEKPKRPPPKKRTESHQDDHAETEAVADPAETPRGPLVETEDDEAEGPTRPQRRRTKSRESLPVAVPVGGSRELFSDTNDADQSAGAETEDNADTAAPSARDPPPPARALHQQPQSPQVDAQAEEASGEDDGESEEEEVDEETRRRLEIRERMAKMSGGMGMAGMFGPPGGMPMRQKQSKPSGDSSKKRAESNESGPAATSAAPVPVMGLPGMALPGMQAVKSPESAENPLEVEKEPEPRDPSTYDSDPDTVPDVEEAEKHAPTARRSDDNARLVSPHPQERPVPQPPNAPRAMPPVPSERPVPPPPPTESRPVPPPPPTEPPMSPESGSESDDELPPPKDLSIDTQAASSRAVPPVPSARPQGPRSPTNKRTSLEIASPASSEAPSPSARRTSRVPPVPGAAAMPFVPSSRAPPPPPPSFAPPSGTSTERRPASLSDSEEVTEYEGDYDTDIASSTHHKEALKAHDHKSSTDETLTGDEASYHHGGLPSLGPLSGPPPIPSSGAPRGVPPPPPSQPPKQSRQSMDLPRGAPPPPPPPPPKTAATDDDDDDDDEYDPYNYTSSRQAPPQAGGSETVVTPRAEDTHFDDDLYSRSPPGESARPSRPAPPSIPSYSSHKGPGLPPPPALPQAPSQALPQAPSQAPPQSPPQMPPATPSSMSRQSLDVPRASTSRRSVDAPRPSIEGGFIADDVDMGRNTQWWIQRKMPPPVFQNRHDVLYEVEESNGVQQNGRELAVKQVYALFMDYSQTVVTARFDPQDPTHVDLQQRYEAPPNRLRQDQLEDAHTKYGAKIAEVANSKVNTVVGNGTPFALVAELLGQFQDALPPVGTRAYGALVYVNLANATVQQHDEIRAGDIVSFRNAKLAGHKGAMKAKYAMDIGKPDSVAIVMDWDGTRKKIRAWEQGRENKKVKVESFKLGDLKSGEVKVWRVMSRMWVGWGGGQ